MQSIVHFVALGAVLVCLSCARAPLQIKSATMSALRADGSTVELRWEEVAEGSPAVDHARAVAAARASLALDAPADGQLVLLTIRVMDSGLVTLDRGKVWLVTFPDVAFTADEACACEGSPARRKTVVAVDASDSAVLASFGVAE